MESWQSKPFPWCPQLFLLKRKSATQELDIKVKKWILTDDVEERLHNIEWDCENSVKSVRREEASFSECSSFLQNDRLMIFRSKLVQFVVYLPKQGKIRRREDRQGFKSENFLLEKITRKYEEVCKCILGLRIEIDAIRRMLVNHLENIPQVSGKDEDL